MKGQVVITTKAQDFTSDIRKVGKQWVVSKPKPAGAATRNKKQCAKVGFTNPDWPNKFRGDTVTWKLDTEESVSAYFQFPAKLFKNVKGERRLSQDMVAKIPGPQGELTLTLEVDPGADRREPPRYYAVWIQPEGGKGTFAVGDSLNPPPEIGVGP